MSAEAAASIDGYDLFSELFGRDAHEQWSAIRESGCPVAHSDLRGGSWLVVNYDDIQSVARDTTRFSSRALEVSGQVPVAPAGLFMPPLTSSPPDHQLHRDVLAPYLTPSRVALLEGFVRNEARRLARVIAQAGSGDAAEGFARPLALAVLTHVMQVPREMQERFVDWATRVIRLGPFDQALRSAAIAEALRDLETLLEERSRAPGDDVVSHIANATIDGQPLSRKHKLGSMLLLVLAGADTTWSAIGSSLLHLAQNPADRARLLADPKMLRTTAIEELLRVFAPLSAARITTCPVSLHGRELGPDERVVLTYGAANRDPSVFPDPDSVQLDRKRNAHMTFGTGIHRCLGSHLARLELRVALDEWLQLMPNFELNEPDGKVPWTVGQIRGPERVLLRVTTA